MADLQTCGTRPPMIVLENVPGLLYGQSFPDLCEALAALHLQFGALLIDAKWFVPQSRARVCFVAIDDSINVQPWVDAMPTRTNPWAPNILWKASWLDSFDRSSCFNRHALRRSINRDSMTPHLSPMHCTRSLTQNRHPSLLYVTWLWNSSTHLLSYGHDFATESKAFNSSVAPRRPPRNPGSTRHPGSFRARMGQVMVSESQSSMRSPPNPSDNTHRHRRDRTTPLATSGNHSRIHLIRTDGAKATKTNSRRPLPCDNSSTHKGKA